MKVPFPDDDKWCFATYEVGMFQGELIKFTDDTHAAHWAFENGIKEYELVKKTF